MNPVLWIESNCQCGESFHAYRSLIYFPCKATIWLWNYPCIFPLTKSVCLQYLKHNQHNSQYNIILWSCWRTLWWSSIAMYQCILSFYTNRMYEKPWQFYFGFSLLCTVYFLLMCEVITWKWIVLFCFFFSWKALFVK